MRTSATLPPDTFAAMAILTRANSHVCLAATFGHQSGAINCSTRSRAALAEWKQAEAAKEETLRAARERADERKAVALWGGDEQMGAYAGGDVFSRGASGPVARGEAALRPAIPLPDCQAECLIVLWGDCSVGDHILCVNCAFCCFIF